jgi:hypothetical protein
MKSVFLIFRPVLDYEDSLTPHFVCETREQAQLIIDRVLEYAERLLRRLPIYDPQNWAAETDPDLILYTELSGKRRAILEKARWPYGLNLESDLPGLSDMMPTINHGILEIMELAFVHPGRTNRSLSLLRNSHE